MASPHKSTSRKQSAEAFSTDENRPMRSLSSSAVLLARLRFHVFLNT